jgi:crotonobetainyl-CoA:carnitine CoA-transferase CaiB-like acyl-CoA transferase
MPAGDNPEETPMIKPLAGIRVLDFSKVLAGPLCTQYLGDLGADIIKVEPCAVGDETRGWPPFHGDTSAFFLSINRNKRSLAVDLKTRDGPRDRAQARPHRRCRARKLRHRRGRTPGHRFRDPQARTR